MEGAYLPGNIRQRMQELMKEGNTAQRKKCDIIKLWISR